MRLSQNPLFQPFRPAPTGGRCVRRQSHFTLHDSNPARWASVESELLAADAMSRAARETLGLYCPHGHVMEDCLDECPEVASESP